MSAKGDETVEASVLFCEQCGARFETAGPRKLRACPGCGRLSCRVCWPTRARKCTECRHLGKVRRVVAPTVAVAHDEPVVQKASVALDEPVVQEASVAHDEPVQKARAHSRVTRPRVVAVSGSAAAAHQDVRVARVDRVRERVARAPRRFRAGFEGPTTIARVLVAVIALVGAMAFAAAVMVPGLRSPQGASPGPLLSIANPTARADAESTPESSTPSGPPPQRTEPPELSGSATLPPTGGTGPGRLETTAERLSVWEDKFGEVRVQVVVTARNAGGAPLVVRTAAASWSVSDEAGDITARGRFAHAFPGVVAPGGEVMLIDGVSAAFAQPAELAKLDVQISNEPVEDDGTIVALEASDLSWTTADDGGLEVSGEVSNPSTGVVTNGTVGIVLKDARGQIVAGAYSVDLGELAAGETRSFVTAYPGTPRINPADVASAEAAASATQ